MLDQFGKYFIQCLAINSLIKTSPLDIRQKLGLRFSQKMLMVIIIELPVALKYSLEKTSWLFQLKFCQFSSFFLLIMTKFDVEAKKAQRNTFLRQNHLISCKSLPFILSFFVLNLMFTLRRHWNSFSNHKRFFCACKSFWLVPSKFYYAYAYIMNKKFADLIEKSFPIKNKGWSLDSTQSWKTTKCLHAELK